MAPNIYYLGYAGVVKYKGIRIGGLSGIYKGFDYFKGHFERPPYDQNTVRSVYHYRQQEVFRLQQLSEPIDVMMSHDWPQEVYNYGNAGQLIRFKPHFRDEIHDNKLGSPPCYELLKKLQPTYWFSGHLHCKFAALIPHEDEKQTKFLALDKCLPKRRFLQIIDFDAVDDESNQLQYDLEWLTILYTTKHLTHVKSTPNYMPGKGNTTCRWDFQATEEEKELVLRRIGGNLNIPQNFERTSAPYDATNPPFKTQQPKAIKNQQTVDFCNLLDIDDPLNLVVILSGQELNRSEYRDIANTSISDSSLVLNESDRADELSETLNSSTASNTSGGVTGLMLKQRLSLFDTLPAPKNEQNDVGNPEETNIDLSDSDKDSTDDKPSADDNLCEKASNTDQEDKKELEQGDDVGGEDTSEELPKIAEKRDGDEELVNALSPDIKKFKRRNIAIYNAESDD